MTQYENSEPLQQVCTVYAIPLESILVDENFNTRSKIYAASCLTLANDIEKNGLIQPVLVRKRTPEEMKQSPEPYELIVGFRRYTAAILLNWTTIPAAVRAMPRKEVLAINVSENKERSALTLREIAHIIKNNADTKTLGELGALIGKDIFYVLAMKKVIKLPPLIQEYFFSEKLSINDIRTYSHLKLAELSKVLTKLAVNREETLPVDKETLFSTYFSVDEIAGFLADSNLPYCVEIQDKRPRIIYCRKGRCRDLGYFLTTINRNLSPNGAEGALLRSQCMLEALGMTNNVTTLPYYCLQFALGSLLPGQFLHMLSMYDPDLDVEKTLKVFLERLNYPEKTRTFLDPLLSGLGPNYSEEAATKTPPKTL